MKELGSGQFGTVYLASKDSQQYAIKSVKSGSVEWKYLDLEVRTIREVDSPYAVRLYEYIWDGTTLHLVMEYCEGGNLEDFLFEERATGDTARRWLWELIQALIAIQSRGIVHRDLKPANLMLTHAKQVEAHVKVTDFGTARFLDNADEPMTTIGTDLYMAPEMFNGQEYDERVDVWNFGVIANELLKGPLFRAVRSVKDLMKEHERTQEIDASCGLPVEAVNLIKAALTKDPAQRPNFKQLLEMPYFSQTYPRLTAGEICMKLNTDVQEYWNCAAYLQGRGENDAADCMYSAYQREAMKMVQSAESMENWDESSKTVVESARKTECGMRWYLRTLPHCYDPVGLVVSAAEKLSQEWWHSGGQDPMPLHAARVLLRSAALDAPDRPTLWQPLQHWVQSKLDGTDN